GARRLTRLGSSGLPILFATGAESSGVLRRGSSEAQPERALRDSLTGARSAPRAGVAHDVQHRAGAGVSPGSRRATAPGPVFAHQVVHALQEAVDVGGLRLDRRLHIRQVVLEPVALDRGTDR